MKRKKFCNFAFTSVANLMSLVFVSLTWNLNFLLQSFFYAFIQKYILLTSEIWGSKSLNWKGQRLGPKPWLRYYIATARVQSVRSFIIKEGLDPDFIGEKKKIPRRSILNVCLTSLSSGALLPPATICIIFHVINLDKRDGFMWVVTNWVRDMGLHARIMYIIVRLFGFIFPYDERYMYVYALFIPDK